MPSALIYPSCLSFFITYDAKCNDGEREASISAGVAIFNFGTQNVVQMHRAEIVNHKKVRTFLTISLVSTDVEFRI